MLETIFSLLVKHSILNAWTKRFTSDRHSDFILCTNRASKFIVNRVKLNYVLLTGRYRNDVEMPLYDLFEAESKLERCFDPCCEKAMQE